MSRVRELSPIRITVRTVQIALGVLWIGDGLLQLQPTENPRPLLPPRSRVRKQQKKRKKRKKIPRTFPSVRSPLASSSVFLMEAIACAEHKRL